MRIIWGLEGYLFDYFSLTLPDFVYFCKHFVWNGCKGFVCTKLVHFWMSAHTRGNCHKICTVCYMTFTSSCCWNTNFLWDLYLYVLPVISHVPFQVKLKCISIFIVSWTYMKVYSIVLDELVTFFLIETPLQAGQVFLQWHNSPHRALASSVVRPQISLPSASFLHTRKLSSVEVSVLMCSSHLISGLPTGFFLGNFHLLIFFRYSRISHSDYVTGPLYCLEFNIFYYIRFI